jgi:hypothetical protein
MHALQLCDSAKRERRCHYCTRIIKPDERHLQFRYIDGSWHKRLNVCNLCLAYVMEWVRT